MTTRRKLADAQRGYLERCCGVQVRRSVDGSWGWYPYMFVDILMASTVKQYDRAATRGCWWSRMNDSDPFVVLARAATVHPGWRIAVYCNYYDGVPEVSLVPYTVGARLPPANGTELCIASLTTIDRYTRVAAGAIGNILPRVLRYIDLWCNHG